MVDLPVFNGLQFDHVCAEAVLAMKAAVMAARPPRQEDLMATVVCTRNGMSQERQMGIPEAKRGFSYDTG